MYNWYNWHGNNAACYTVCFVQLIKRNSLCGKKLSVRKGKGNGRGGEGKRQREEGLLANNL